MVKPETPTDQLILFFSNWISLLKAVAWYRRLMKVLMVKKKKTALLTLRSSKYHPLE